MWTVLYTIKDRRTFYNVQWVHKEINRFKNNYPQEKFIAMCKEVVDYSGE